MFSSWPRWGSGVNMAERRRSDSAMDPRAELLPAAPSSTLALSALDLRRTELQMYCSAGRARGSSHGGASNAPASDAVVCADDGGGDGYWGEEAGSGSD